MTDIHFSNRCNDQLTCRLLWALPSAGRRGLFAVEEKEMLAWAVFSALSFSMYQICSWWWTGSLHTAANSFLNDSWCLLMFLQIVCTGGTRPLCCSTHTCLVECTVWVFLCYQSIPAAHSWAYKTSTLCCAVLLSGNYLHFHHLSSFYFILRS